MDIITGYLGEPHVTSEQDRDINIGIVGDGSYVMPTGQRIAAEVSNNNEIRIRDGLIIHQGCAASIKKNTYDSVNIINGSQGMKRIDLIVARYQREAETDKETISLVVIQGTPAESDPVVPEHTEGDIQAGDSVADMPLYQVTIDGLNITEVKKVFEEITSLKELNSKIGVLQDTDSTSESAIASNGRALKIYDATENVTYGCWEEGIYTVKPYVPGSPSNWGGMCLVTHVRDSGGGFNSYVKTFFSSDCKVYVMRQTKDGTVDQNWTAQS